MKHEENEAVEALIAKQPYELFSYPSDDPQGSTCWMVSTLTVPQHPVALCGPDNDFAKALCAHLNALSRPAAIPRETTAEMIEAGEDLIPVARGTESRKIGGVPNPEDIWRAMYDAAPIVSQEVSQEDREAAADLYEYEFGIGDHGSPTLAMMRASALDDHHFVEAFRNHRLRYGAQPAEASGEGLNLAEIEESAELLGKLILPLDRGLHLISLAKLGQRALSAPPAGDVAGIREAALREAADLVRNWNGETRVGDTVHIADAILELAALSKGAE